MKYAVGLAVAFVLFGVARAVEPATTAPISKPAPAGMPPKPPSKAVAPPALRRPLDLRVGDIRNYMTPREYQAALAVPDADRTTIVVEGQRVLVPMERIEDVPPGLVSLWYAAKHPLNSWRLLAPMVNAPEFKPPLDKVPPPVFRWGP